MDLADIGGSSLDKRTNTLLVQCKSAPMGEDENDAPQLGDAPILGALGVTARPWPKDARGTAQGVVAQVPGSNGAVIAARDTRSAAVVAQLAPGETCLHSTGKDFDSRFFCKDQHAAIVVGDDTVISVDRKNKKISITGFGASFQISEHSGICMAQGGAMIQVKDGIISLMGKIVLGGRNPLAPMAAIVNGAPAPAPGVFLGGA